MPIKFLRVFTNRAPHSHEIIVPVEVIAESAVAGHPLATIRPVGGAGECRVRQVNLSDTIDPKPQAKKVRK